ncbi:inactive RHOMBOID-like protein 8 [Aristolochia californica]|uniref:inactive RHOMBOID-like protein 8 n=1 Tax=Aristolochia californica TaxID=171875 RepID=UPI0035E30D12
MAHLQVDVGALSADEGVENCRIPFFGSRSRRTKTTSVTLGFAFINVGVFFAMMTINDCYRNSHGQCSLKFLKRFSFQPLSENPLLGPASSTLIKLGALERTLMTENQKWRLFTSMWLHAGLIHLILSLSSLIFIGFRLEKAFGPWRVGVVYLLSSFMGSLVSAIFLHLGPTVGSSAALFGLIGALFADLIMNWNIYYNKLEALLFLFLAFIANFLLGLLPLVDNASNIAGFLSGILLGFVLLYDPLLGNPRRGLYELGLKKSSEIKVKLDQPVLRTIFAVLFGVILAGCLLAVLLGVNGNKYCRFCHYLDCLPSKRWSCMEHVAECTEIEHGGRLTLTCIANDRFRMFPFTNISKARMKDLCNQICNSQG